MKNFIISISIILFLAVIGFGVKYSGVFSGVPVVEDEDFKKIEGRIPNVKFTTLSGETVGTHDFQGKVVLLNFWASWCAPCVEEFPSMLRLMKRFEGQLVFMAVSNDTEKIHITKFLKPFRKKFGQELKSPLLHMIWDQEMGITQENFNVLKMPETIIIGTDLKMAKKVVGATEWDGPEMVKYIEDLLTTH